MTLNEIVNRASDKTKFLTVRDFIDFGKTFLEFIETGKQATIISQNENHYQFFQYREDGNFSITRPLNSNLMYTISEESKFDNEFALVLSNLRSSPECTADNRELIMRGIYTLQQSIGCALDALPAGESNRARKIAGDLFERFIQLLLGEIGVICKTGTVRVPIYVEGELVCKMNYQHDLLLHDEEELKAIGSVKTSSKDRIDKIFLDKFLYSKLTETALPHIAIFLNDVQRKQTKKEGKYGINSTFLSGHFKAFTIKLNPLDGVYYCDIRPNMVDDAILKQHIKTIDHFFCTDVWELISREGVPLQAVEIEVEEENKAVQQSNENEGAETVVAVKS